MLVSGLSRASKGTCKYKGFVLAFVWIVGLTIGAHIQYWGRAFFTPLIRATATCSVSVSYALCCNLLTWLIFSLINLVAISSAAYILFALRAFGVGFILVGILFCFESGGWLIACVMLFCASFTNCFLFWLFLSNDFYNRGSPGISLLISFLFILGLSLLDCFWFSPFLVRVMHYI